MGLGYSKRMHKGGRGFTIVELLIVIVVIGILAALVISTFAGAQERARYASYQTDIKAIQKAILAFHADNSYYPYSGTTASCGTNTNGNTTSWVPGVAPKYINSLPLPASAPNDYYAYCWAINGADYKLIRLVPGGVSVPQIEIDDATKKNMMDPVRGTRGWGYWSSGCSAC